MAASLSGVLDFPPWFQFAGGAVLIAGALAAAAFLGRRRAPSLLRDFLLLLLLTVPLFGAQLVLAASPPEWLWKDAASRAIRLGAVVLLAYGVGRLLITAVRLWAEKSEAVRTARKTLELIVRVASLSMGGLILLDTLGISITPLLTTLGIGSLAVALALQDTLANFFAGLYLAADRPIRTGDFVRLDSGDEGYVESVGWRSTRLRTLPNNIVVIPNERVAKSIITNFDFPEPRMSLLLRVSASYDSDSRRIERILLDVTQAATRDVPGLLPEPAPFVRFIPGFGDSALEFTLICQVARFVDQYSVQHELRHRILDRFRQEGIEIPFPQRVITVKEAGSPHADPWPAGDVLTRRPGGGDGPEPSDVRGGAGVADAPPGRNRPQA